MQTIHIIPTTAFLISIISAIKQLFVSLLPKSAVVDPEAIEEDGRQPNLHVPPMTETRFKAESTWFKGSRIRAHRNRINSNYNVRRIDQYKDETEIPELLRLKKIQELWNSEENNESFTG